MATILIIDDEAHVRMLYEEELTQLGHEVKSADGDGDMATLVGTISPDLIILDIKLDGKSGLDVLQEIRARHAEVPIILNTAYDSFRYDLKSIAADDYVVKSYDSSELLEKVRQLLACKPTEP